MTQLRRDALSVLKVGLAAINTRRAVETLCRLKGNILTVNGHRYDLRKYRRMFVIGIGKASAEASEALEATFGDRIADGVALDVKRARTRRIRSVVGTHPFPSVENMRATGDIMAILKQLDSRDLVVAVVSGGGSSMLCWPYQLKCDDVSAMTRSLMARGADIREINTVRKHISEIQGGQFARLAYPATILSLIFSDVPGDDIGVVASGPTVMDRTTVEDAQRVMEKYDLLRVCRLPGCDLRETPKDPVFFERVTNVLAMSNAVALEAMRVEAERLGYRARILSATVEGEAREVGAMLAGLPGPGEMVLAGGETTVTVRGKGKGGRNQEVALGALSRVADDGLVLSCASDGVDNSPAAGAVAEASVRKKAARLKLNPQAFLSRNDSLTFFEGAGGRIVTGVTGANVSDLMLAARAKS
jgi:glycerate-2-kinase